MVAIDDIDKLRSWLVKKLGPVCDADPNALAKYVVALVKKDKSENDLKASCKDQLDVFLQKETEPFVSDLFETLKTKSYLHAPPEPPTSVPEKTDKEKSKDSQRSHKPQARSKSPRPRHRSPVNEPRGRRGDEHRFGRRSPVESRRHYGGGRRRSRSRSPRRRGRSSASPHRRKHRTSPRRSRSPQRKRSLSKSSNDSNASSNRRRSSSHSPEHTTSNDKPNDTPDKKERCWDYDQKGFCMKGDLCPYDHGTDAVVVDDISLGGDRGTGGGEPNRPDGGGGGGKKGGETVGQAPIRPHPVMPMPPAIMNVAPPMSIPPPHLLHRFPPPMNINIPPPQILPPPQQQAVPPPYNPELPSLHNVDDRPNNQDPPSITITNLLGGKPNFQVENQRKRSGNDAANNGPAMKRTFYNNNSQNQNKRGTILIVKKIPPILNNITKLNEHFSKFGAINNIQVKLESLPDQALIEYAHPASARAAIRDTGAVLGNRFIRVHWPDDNELAVSSPGDRKPTIKDRIGTIPNPDQLKYTAPGLNDKKPATAAEAASTAVLSRTIANPDAPAPAASPTEEDIAKKKVAELEKLNEAKKKVIAARQNAKQKDLLRQRQVLMKKVELQKQREGLMQKQIEQQKLLLAKLDAHRNMPLSEKQELMKTLKALTSSIDTIRNLQNNVTKQLGKDKQEKHKQTQKEMLDTEMDLYNATTTGENTYTLKRKLNQLKMEASSMGLVTTGHRGGWSHRGRGRGAMMAGGRGRGANNSHRLIRAGSNLDRRPCELRISGFHEDEKDEMIAHFSEFGEIETFSFDEDNITCTVKYKTRTEAEQAASHGCTFKRRNLIAVWAATSAKPACQIKTESATATENASPYASHAVSSPVHQMLLQKATAAAGGNNSTSGSPKIADAGAAHSDDDDEDISVVVDPVVHPFQHSALDDDFGYGLLEEELDEDALLTGADIDDDDDDDDVERSWRH